MGSGEMLVERRDSGFMSARHVLTVLGIAGIVAYGLGLREESTKDQRQDVTTTLPSPEGLTSIPLDATIQTTLITLTPEDQAILDAIEAHHTDTATTLDDTTSPSAVPAGEEPVDASHEDHPVESMPAQTSVTQPVVATPAPQETSHDHVTTAPNSNAPVTATTHPAHQAPAQTTPTTQPNVVATTVAVTHETVPVTASGAVPIPAG